MSSVEELVSEMRQMDRKFKRACQQVILLNNRIKETQTKYDRAVRKRRRSFRYHNRLRQVTLEGVRNMFLEYANRHGDRLDEMQDRLMEEFNVDWDVLDAQDNQQQWRDILLPLVRTATEGPFKGRTPSQKSTWLLCASL